VIRICCVLLGLLVPTAADEAQSWEGLKEHAKPSARAATETSEDWPRFLGAADQAVSGETGLCDSFGETGPSLLWECAKGDGYASPAIVGDRLLLFHRVKEHEQIDCLHPETGRRYWSHRYPVEYRDDFGFSPGPRAGPVVAGDAVITFGVTSVLRCLALATGQLRWEHDCGAEYGVMKYFFGSGASPLVMGDRVIANLGGSEERCVVAFDLKSGRELWVTKHEWGQSYASPIPAVMQGQPRVLVFAGGKSEPSTGGLLCIDPATGAVDDAFFWRARRYASVNAASPTLCGPNRVFISNGYKDRDAPCNGGVMLEMGADRKFKAVWKAEDFAVHWMTPVFADGMLYGFHGEKDRTCELVGYDAETGVRRWGKRMEWEHEAPTRSLPLGLMRGSLLKVGEKFLALGEWGSVCWLQLDGKDATLSSKFQPFVAEQSWTLPALSRGLLFLSQNDAGRTDASRPRLLCYDLRAAR
jgi:outer membrane protein assembly factor BamB